MESNSKLHRAQGTLYLIDTTLVYTYVLTYLGMINYMEQRLLYTYNLGSYSYIIIDFPAIVSILLRGKLH